MRAPASSATVLLISCAIALAGCGGDGEEAPGPEGAARKATLVLDFLPGPVHAGIYRALDQGYDREQGIELEIVEPTSTADTLKLIDGGKADAGIADGIDVANQIAQGRGAKGIMAVTQRPLGGLITLAESGYSSPADLEGATVGVTGVPSDGAVLEAVISGAGGDPESVREVTIGFNGVQHLESGNVDAFTGYIPADGVQAEVDGFETTTFALDEFGGPQYPGLVLFSTADRIERDPELLRGLVTAIARGYEDLLADPEAGLEALLADNPAIPREFAAASLEAHLPLLRADADRYGVLRAEKLEELSRFLVAAGLIEEPIDPERYATNELLDDAG